MADHGQDPTECAVPWKKFKEAGFQVDFATENGIVPEADQKLVQKSLFQSVMGPKAAWTNIYHEMTKDESFLKPYAWSKGDFSMQPYNAVILPGGHDKPIKQYLESKSLHKLLATYWPLTRRIDSSAPYSDNQPSRVVGAICHGVLVAAFTSPLDADPNASSATDEKGKRPSILADVESTTLPQWLESTGQTLGSLWGLGQYYRTYPDRYTYQDLVAVLDKKEQYKSGPPAGTIWRSFTHTDPRYHYISGRWPGDAEEFGDKLIQEITRCREEFESRPSAKL